MSDVELSGEQLEGTLQAVKDNLSDVQKSIDIPTLYKRPIATLEALSEDIQKSKELTDDAKANISKTMKWVIETISSTWNPPITERVRDNMTQARSELNRAIVAMNQTEVELSDFAPLKEDYLNHYIETVYDSVKNKYSFFRAVKAAYSMNVQRDVRYLLDGIDYTCEYFNDPDYKFEEFQWRIQNSFLFYLATAHMINYDKEKELEAKAIEFSKLTDSCSAEFCFDLLEEFYHIYVTALPRKVKSRDWIVNSLFCSYTSVSKAMNIAEVLHYTQVCAREESEEKREAYVKVASELRKCYRRTVDVNTVDFTDVVQLLRPEVPEKKAVVERETTLPDFLKVEPVKVVEAAQRPVFDAEMNPQFYYSDKWTLNAATDSGYDFAVDQTPDVKYQEPESLEICNEFNLPKSDQGRSQSYIHVPLVGQILRAVSNSAKNPELSFHEVGEVVTSSYFKPDVLPIKQGKHPHAKGYVEFKLTDLKLEGKVVDLTIAMIYVLDTDKGQALSEPVFYTVDGGKLKTLDGSEKALFCLPFFGPSVHLVLRLFHNQSSDIQQFLKYIKDPKNSAKPTSSPYGFAVNSIPLFDGNCRFSPPASYPENFHLLAGNPQLGSDRHVGKILAQAPGQKITVQTSYEIKMLQEKPSEGLCHSWPSKPAATLVAESCDYDMYSITPLISISDVKFTFKKPPKGEFCFFTAYLCETDKSLKSPSGIPAILGYESSKPIAKYTSSILPAAAQLCFPDIVRFVIDHQMSENAHIIIHFCVIPAGKAPSIYKTSVIQLYTDKKPIRSESQWDIPLFEMKNVQDSGYMPIKMKKLNPQSRTVLTISIPPVFLPHGVFFDLMKGIKQGGSLKELILDDVPAQMQLEALLPACARFLDIVGKGNLFVFATFLSSFERDKIVPILKEWTYTYFKPLVIDDFIVRFFGSYASALDGVFKMPTDIPQRVHYLCNYMKTATYFIDFATMSLLANQYENKSFTDEQHDKIEAFTKSLTTLLTTMISLEWADDVNRSLVQFLFLSQTILKADVSLRMIKNYLVKLESSTLKVFDLTPLFPPPPETKPKHPPPEPPIPKPRTSAEPLDARSLKFKLFLAQVFARTDFLLARIAYDGEDSSIFDILFDSAAECLRSNLPIAKDWMVALCEFVRTNEHFPSISPRCANAFISYLTFAMNHCDTPVFKTDYAMFQNFIVPVMYVIHTADDAELAEYFKHLSEVDQTRFIEFLETLIVLCLGAGTELTNPLAEIKNTGFQERADEAAEIERVGKHAKDVNLRLFSELSVRIVEFLLTLLDKVRLDKHPDVLKAISSLISALFNRYQDVENFMNIMLVVSRLIDQEAAYYFFHITDSFRILVQLAMKLVDRRLRMARASGVAMLIHLLYVEYSNSENVIVSMSEIFDQFIEIMFAVPVYKLGLYKMLLERMRLFLTSFRLPAFVKMCEERLDAGKIVYDACANLRTTNTAPEFQVAMYSSIASQFYGYPILRLKFLERIVEINAVNNLLAQAFEAQIQVCAMIERVIRIIGTEHVHPIDFSFVPSTSVEQNVNVSHCSKDGQKMLCTHDEFCVTGLADSLRKAVTFARAGDAHWLYRQCYKVLIEVKEKMRDYDDLMQVVKGIAEGYDAMEETTTPPLFFYLVEKRRNNEYVSRQVFASRIPNLNDFAEFLNSKKFQRFEFGEPAIPYPNSIEAAKCVANGICVSPCYAKESLTNHNYTSTFSQSVHFSAKALSALALKRLIITTAVPHPNCSIVADVADVEEKSFSKYEHVKLYITESIERLRTARLHLAALLPSEKLVQKWKTVKPVLSLWPCLTEVRRAIEEGTLFKSVQLALVIAKKRVEMQNLITELCDELELDIRTLITAHQEQPEVHMERIKEVQELMRKFQAFLSANIGRQLNVTVIPPQKDPLSFHRDYEDY